MLAEVISFGGRCKDVKAIVRSKIRQSNTKGEKPVRIKQESEEKTIVVQIKVKQRDTAETVDEIDEATGKKTGKKVKNDRYGKFYYESFDSFELEQATADEVRATVKEALLRASKK
jgi:Cu/Ag efflux pump CusA